MKSAWGRIAGFAALAIAAAGFVATGMNGAGGTGKDYKFDKIAEGIYYASGTGPMATGGNHPIIVGEHDVLVVDSGITPEAGRELLKEMKTITDKPVRWVVNTHYHFDHTNGNQIFGPEVQIVAHDFVRSRILSPDMKTTEPYKTSIGSIPSQIEALKKQQSSATDSAKKADIAQQIGALQGEEEGIKELKVTPPTVTYSKSMTIHQGNREIDLLFLGRGHTQGDTVVYLPKERIVCTGDLMESRPAFMGDGIFDEWIATLDAIKKLDFDTVLPGHGVPFHGKTLITEYQSYLKDYINQVAALRKQGLSADDAAKKVDMTSHRKAFPDIEGPGVEVRGVRRMYQWMDEKGMH